MKNGEMHPGQKFIQTEFMCLNKQIRVSDVFNGQVNAFPSSQVHLLRFVVGAANAGKSAFIRRLLDRLEVKFPQGKVEQCTLAPPVTMLDHVGSERNTSGWL